MTTDTTNTDPSTDPSAADPILDAEAIVAIPDMTGDTFQVVQVQSYGLIDRFTARAVQAHQFVDHAAAQVFADQVNADIGLDRFYVCHRETVAILDTTAPALEVMAAPE